MLTWQRFVEAEPDLAEAARDLLYQFGVGLGFLATVGADGFPRTHPVRPVIASDGLFVFVVDGPKLRDLRRDGRYALHCFPPPDNEDGFHVTGTAVERREPARRAEVEAAIRAESNLAELPPEHAGLPLFEFLVRSALVTRTDGHGDFHPRHTIWRDPTASRRAP